MVITENIQFWRLIYTLEFTFLAQIIIGNHLNLSIKNLLYTFSFGISFGILIIVVMIYILSINEPPLLYFWASAVVSIWILFVTQSINKKTSENIKDTLERVKRIEERLDGLHKK